MPCGYRVGNILSGEESSVVFTGDTLLHSLNQRLVELILEMNEVLTVILDCDADSIDCIAAAYPAPLTITAVLSL